MKTMRQSGWAVAAVMSAVLSMQAAAQQQAAAPQISPVKRVIVVSLQDRKLALLEDGKVTRIYTVAVGKPSTPSPVGTFTIVRRVINPTYSHNGIVVPPGPHNPVGDRWMGLSIRGYGIHGTNVPSSIGKAASHGCIRMGKADVEDLFAQVSDGDTVELIGARNQETARLFAPASDAASQATQTAKTEPAAPAAGNPTVTGSM